MLVRAALREANREARDVANRVYAIEEVFGPVEKRPKDPKNRREMLESSHAQQFLEGEIKEFGDLIEMGVFEWVNVEDLRPDDEVIDLTWRYRRGKARTRRGRRTGGAAGGFSLYSSVTRCLPRRPRPQHPRAAASCCAIKSTH